MSLKIYQKYITLVFFKNFFILFFALQFFYLGIDLMQNFRRLPNSANLQILYTVYTFLNAINFTIPISILFAMIISKFYLIRTNELIAMYAVGISKNRLIKPIFISSLLITIFYVLLNFTSFAYAKDYAHNILTNSTVLNNSNNLFLKYFDKYIYIKKLNPLKKEAFDIKIFEVKNGDLSSIVSAKKAKFSKNYWILSDVNIVKKPNVDDKIAKLSQKQYHTYKALKGFKPKIIESIYEGKSNFSIMDALDAINLFLSQNVNISKIKASLYTMLIFPFFAPLLSLILFYYMPISSRFFNLALSSSIFVFISLVVWAMLFMFVKMSINSVVSPEVGIILPIMLLAIFAFYKYSRNE